MKIETDIPYPFTLEQLNALSAEQRQAIEAVAEYLTGRNLSNATNFTDEDITDTFNLLKPCEGCVPSEEADEDLLKTIRKKFGAVYQVGMELAEAELKSNKRTGISFCYLADPSYEDATHIAIVDYNRPICYLHEWTKAWHLEFASLPQLADAVLQVKKTVADNATRLTKSEIRPGEGQVSEIIDLPENIKPS